MEAPDRLLTAQVLLSAPDYDWERRGFWVNEGAAVLERDGRLFLTYSASSTGADYCMGMLRLRRGGDPLDPADWSKSREPVMKTDVETVSYTHLDVYKRQGSGNPGDLPELL